MLSDSPARCPPGLLLKLATSHPELFFRIAYSNPAICIKTLRATNRFLRSLCDANATSLCFNTKLPNTPLHQRFPRVDHLYLTARNNDEAAQLGVLAYTNPTLLSSLSSMSLTVVTSVTPPEITTEVSTLLRCCPGLRHLTLNTEREISKLPVHTLEFEFPPDSPSSHPQTPSSSHPSNKPWTIQLRSLLSCHCSALLPSLKPLPLANHLVSLTFSSTNLPGEDFEQATEIKNFEALCSLSWLTCLVYSIGCIEVLPASSAVLLTQLTNLRHLELNSPECTANIAEPASIPLYSSLHLLTTLTHLKIQDSHDSPSFNLPPSWSALVNLRELFLSAHHIRNLSPLSSLSSLSVLSINVTMHTSISFLHPMASLTCCTLFYSGSAQAAQDEQAGGALDAPELHIAAPAPTADSAAHDASPGASPAIDIPSSSLVDLTLSDPPSSVIPQLCLFTALTRLKLQCQSPPSSAPLPVSLLELKLTKLRKLCLSKPTVSPAFLLWISSLPCLSFLDLEHPIFPPCLAQIAVQPAPLLSLKHLDIYHLCKSVDGAQKGLQHLLCAMHMPQLTALYASCSFDFAAVQLLLRNSPHLGKQFLCETRTIRVDDAELLTIAKTYPEWFTNRCLCFENGGGLTPTGIIEAIAVAGPCVEWLDLPFEFYTNGVVKAIASNCPNLRGLKLPLHPTLGNDVWSSFSRNCSRLECLEISSLPYQAAPLRITTEGMLFASCHWQQLRKLELVNCHLLTPCLAGRLGALPFLKILDVAECDRFNTACLVALLCSNPRSLLVVRVFDCALFIKEEAARALVRMQGSGIAVGWKCWQVRAEECDYVEVCKGLGGRENPLDDAFVF